MTALVEPPIAFTTDIAFSNASKLKISLGLISLSTNADIDFPVILEMFVLLSLSAGAEALPGKEIPRASLTEAIVLAVYIPPQDPDDGQATFSNPVSCCKDNFPTSYAPTASYTSCIVTSQLFHLPGRIVPPYAKMAGMLTLAMPIRVPGRLLSQPAIPIIASY